MRISPLVRTSFKGDFGLGEEIKNALSKKLGIQTNNLETDEFVPSTPSSPIVVEKIEIHQGEKSEKGLKGLLKSGGVATGGVATGYGVKDLVSKKEDSINKIFNSEDIDTTNTNDTEDDNTDIANINSTDNDDFNTTDNIDDSFDDDDDMAD